jgi:hypothetical protein
MSRRKGVERSQKKVSCKKYARKTDVARPASILLS